MKNFSKLVCLIAFICLIFSQDAITQTVKKNSPASNKKEAELNKKFENCSMLDFNGTTLELSISSTAVSDSTDKKEMAFEISPTGISNDKYSIKLGMNKVQVSQIAKKMGIVLLKKTSKYWLFSNTGIMLKFQNDKLVSIPGICQDFDLIY